MPSSRLASKATSSALRAASSGWSRFVREMHHPRTLQMIAYAIVLLVLVVLVGMVCLASRKELFVVRPKTDTLQTLSTLHTVEGFEDSATNQASTSPNGSTSPQCNDYAIVDQCNNYASAGRLHNGEHRCSYYLRNKPVIHENSIHMNEANDLKFCHSPNFLTSDSSSTRSPASSATSPASPAPMSPTQTLKTCNSITLDSIMKQMQQNMNDKVNAAKTKMNTQLEQTTSKMHTALSTALQNAKTEISDKQAALTKANSQKYATQDQQLSAANNQNTEYQSQMSTLKEKLQECTPPPTSTHSTYHSTYDSAIPTEESEESFTNPMSPTQATGKGCYGNPYGRDSQSCASYTVPLPNKPSLFTQGMYIDSPDRVHLGNTTLTQQCNQAIANVEAHANTQVATFQSDAEHAHNDMNARIKTTQSNVAQIVTAGPS